MSSMINTNWGKPLQDWTFLSVKHTFEGDREPLFELPLCAESAWRLPEPTEPQQHRRDLSQTPSWWRQSVFGLGPADPGPVQLGVDVIPAQRFGLRHQLLVSGRTIKHFRGEHGGAAQHLHAPVTLRGARCSPPRLLRLAQRPLLLSRRPPCSTLLLLPCFPGDGRLSHRRKTRISVRRSFDRSDKASGCKRNQSLSKSQDGEFKENLRHYSWKVLRGSTKVCAHDSNPLTRISMLSTRQIPPSYIWTCHEAESGFHWHVRFPFKSAGRLSF